MTLPPFKTPGIYSVNIESIHLSGRSLIELMEAVLNKGYPFRFCAKGWSMTPFIRDGDTITISPLQDRSPGFGEIIAFENLELDKLVVHRVIGRNNGKYILRGDSITGKSSDIVSPGLLLGHVTGIERNEKKLGLGLGTERYLIALLSRMDLLIPLSKWYTNWRNRLKNLKRKF